MKNVLAFAVVATLFLYAYAEDPVTPAAKPADAVVPPTTAGAVPGGPAPIEPAVKAAKDTSAKAVEAGNVPVNAGTGIIQSCVTSGLGILYGLTITAVYSPPKHEIQQDDYEKVFTSLGELFIAGGIFGG